MRPAPDPVAFIRLDPVQRQLAEKEAQLTAWDQKVGDGDCGQAWLAGATCLKAAVEDGEKLLLRTAVAASGSDGTADDLPWASPAIFGHIASVLASGMGGTSGAICQIFFRGMAVSLAETAAGERGPRALRKAFEDATAKVMQYGGARPGMRTLVDALMPAANALRQDGTLEQAAEAALAGAERTKAMEGSAGRSNYVPKEALAATPDPGAMAVAFCLAAIAGDT